VAPSLVLIKTSMHDETRGNEHCEAVQVQLYTCYLFPT
jgi:hypothetical protein